MTRDLHGTTVRLVRGDLTDQAVDAIVNAANRSLLGGGGVDGAIHRRGGPAILDACREIRRTQYPEGLPTGRAVLTTGGALPARFVIHTVGPVWRGGDEGEPGLLADAYRHTLTQALQHGLRTIAFPSISTGAYGYPVGPAAETALQAVADALRRQPGAFDEVRFVLFTQADYTTYADALGTLGEAPPEGL